MDALARSWKLIVLIAAALGSYGFFQSFFEYEDADVEVSAYRIVVGFKAEDIARELGIPADSRDVKDQLRKRNEWVRSDHVAQAAWGSTEKKSFVPYYFLTAALLIAIAFYAFVERKLRTSAAWAVVIASLPALWGFSRAWRGVSITNDLSLGPGALILGGTGVLALAVGIAALIREDPGGFFKNAPTDDDEIVEELEDPYGRRTRRDPRD